MPTTSSDHLRHLLITMLLGLAMAAGIAVLAEPALAWLGFALAATYRHVGGGRSCAARLPVRGRG